MFFQEGVKRVRPFYFFQKTGKTFDCFSMVAHDRINLQKYKRGNEDLGRR